MSSYQEQIAQWRVQRAQQQIADRCQQIRSEYSQVQRERDEAIASNDLDTAELRDMDCQQLEEEWRRYNPPQQTIDPRLVRFAQRNSQFLEKYGARAYQALDEAHKYMMRPRRSDTNNPAYTGMGWNPRAVFTPQYFDKLKSLLELHGEQFLGVRYNRDEEALTANEAARISGLSPQRYNQAARAVAAHGKFGTRR
jgi:hypothetical protein